MSQVELHPAFVWDCDNCGRQNFERAIIPPFQSIEEERAAYTMLDLTPGEAFPVLAPFNVTCRSCGAVFDTDTTNIYGDEDNGGG